MFLIGPAANILPYALVGIISLILMIKGAPKLEYPAGLDTEILLSFEQDIDQESSQDFNFDDYIAEFHDNFSVDVFSLSDVYCITCEKLKNVASKPSLRGPPIC